MCPYKCKFQTTNLIGLDNLYLSQCRGWLSDSNFWILRIHLLMFKGTISQVVNITDSWTFNLLAQSFWCSEKNLYCCEWSLGIFKKLLTALQQSTYLCTFHRHKLNMAGKFGNMIRTILCAYIWYSQSLIKWQLGIPFSLWLSCQPHANIFWKNLTRCFFYGLNYVFFFFLNKCDIWVLCDKWSGRFCHVWQIQIWIFSLHVFRDSSYQTS